MSKKKRERRICTNYAKECPIANRCANCKNRLMLHAPNGNFEIKCKKKNDTDGDTSKCFECSSEGFRCKTE